MRNTICKIYRKECSVHFADSNICDRCLQDAEDNEDIYDLEFYGVDQE